MLKPPEATFLGEGPVAGNEPTPARMQSTVAEELSSKGEHRATMGGSPAIVPKTTLMPDDSSHIGGRAPLPKGLRTESSRRGSLHHED